MELLYSEINLIFFVAVAISNFNGAESFVRTKEVRTEGSSKEAIRIFFAEVSRIKLLLHQSALLSIHLWKESQQSCIS